MKHYVLRWELTCLIILVAILGFSMVNSHKHKEELQISAPTIAFDTGTFTRIDKPLFGTDKKNANWNQDYISKSAFRELWYNVIPGF